MTKAVIGVKEDNQSIKSIRCRLDGGIEHVGTLLCTAYQEIGKIKLLLSYGDIEMLSVFIENDTEWKKKHSTVFYKRDYHEDEQFNKAREYSSMDKLMEDNKDADFYYVFDKGKWIFLTKGNIYERVYDLKSAITDKFLVEIQEEIALVLAGGEQEHEI